MLHFTFGATATVYLTLMETATLTSPYFLFAFTCRVPDDVVTAVLTPVAITDRSERFDINVDTVFAGCDPGQYTYVVYEQASSSNTDPTAAGKELERGIVQLHPEDAFAFTQRTTTTHFIQPTT